MMGRKDLCTDHVLGFASSLDAAHAAAEGALIGYYTPGQGNYSVAMMNAYLLHRALELRREQAAQLKIKADLWGQDTMPLGYPSRTNTAESEAEAEAATQVIH